MRPALLPLAIAAAAVAWTFQAISKADEPSFPVDGPGVAVPKSDWHGLLASPALGKKERAILARLTLWLDPATYRALTPRQRTLLLRYAENRLEGSAPLARCWSPDTPEYLLLAYHAVEEAALQETPLAPRKANQFFKRWSRTATDGTGQAVQGRPVTLTWSIVPDGTPIPSEPTIGDTAEPSDLRARLAELYGGNTGPPEDQPWFPVIREVFDNIGSKTGIQYRYEPEDDGQTIGGGARGVLGVRGDIRLGGHTIDGAGATLAYTFFPDDGDTIFDTDDNWFDNLSNNSIRFANTLEHEHGHGLGLEHVCPLNNSKMMEPFINTRFRGMQFDDLYTLHRWYGDFYEQHGESRNNDTINTAAPLSLPPDSPFQFEWLSIDGRLDQDYFSIQLPPDSRITIRVTPSTGAYLEGAQNANGTCSSGEAFDPGIAQDLALELIGPDRSTILAAATANPAGQLEEIVDFALPEGGRHFIRVNGDSNDRAQLYRLEIDVAAPAVAIELQHYALTEESFSPPTSALEPGETVEIEVTLTNLGSLDAQDVQATLSGPEGFTDFSGPRELGTLAPGALLSPRFVFGLDRPCGQSIPLQLIVTAAGGYQQSLPLRFMIGTIATVLQESFDHGEPALPAGWSSSQTGAGSGWNASDARADSLVSSAFAENVDRTGTSTLTSPPFTLGDSGGTLRFRHYFDTEARSNTGFDGGVLEISLADGPWQDILESGATFLEGPYNRTLSSAHENPLPNRQAWAHRSGGWISTAVALPPSLSGQPLRFRWRLGHDSSVAEEGWYLDDIQVDSPECAATAPLVTMTLLNDTASEFSPQNRGLLRFSTSLPPLRDLAISLLNTGTALVGIDVIGLSEIVLPAGQTSVEVEVLAVNDSEVEGEESLVLSIDPSSGLIPGGPPHATITISDPPYGQWAATTLGLGTNNLPLQDRDGDRSLNLEEYVWQTDGASPASFPTLTPLHQDGWIRIELPFSALPSDVSVHAQSSLDLQNWTSTGVQTLQDGFQVAAQEAQRYLRLVYGLLPAAP